MIGKGLQLAVSTDGTSYTNITGRTETQLTRGAWNTFDSTNHDTETPVKTILPTLRDNHEVSMTIAPWQPATNSSHALLRSLNKTGATTYFKLTYPGNSTGVFTFTGVILSYEPDTPVDGPTAAKFIVKVKGAIADVAAALSSVTVADSFAGVYETDDVMSFYANFDSIVKVTGTPRIEVTIGSNTRYATYASGTGTYRLRFNYTIVSGDAATATQVTVVSPLQLNSGTIKDLGNNNASPLTFTAPNTSAWTVN